MRTKEPLSAEEAIKQIEKIIKTYSIWRIGATDELPENYKKEFIGWWRVTSENEAVKVKQYFIAKNMKESLHVKEGKIVFIHLD